jgi:hypothetical protein
MTEKSYKQEVIESAIQGLAQGGMQKDIANAFYLLFERVYDSGYNEARRNIEEQNTRNIIYSEDISKMSLTQAREYLEKVRNEPTNS